MLISTKVVWNIDCIDCTVKHIKPLILAVHSGSSYEC